MVCTAHYRGVPSTRAHRYLANTYAYQDDSTYHSISTSVVAPLTEELGYEVIDRVERTGTEQELSCQVIARLAAHIPKGRGGMEDAWTSPLRRSSRDEGELMMQVAAHSRASDSIPSLLTAVNRRPAGFCMAFGKEALDCVQDGKAGRPTH